MGDKAEDVVDSVGPALVVAGVVAGTGSEDLWCRVYVKFKLGRWSPVIMGRCLYTLYISGPVRILKYLRSL